MMNFSGERKKILKFSIKKVTSKSKGIEAKNNKCRCQKLCSAELWLRVHTLGVNFSTFEPQSYFLNWTVYSKKNKRGERKEID